MAVWHGQVFTADNHQQLFTILMNERNVFVELAMSRQLKSQQTWPVRPLLFLPCCSVVIYCIQSVGA